MMQKEEEFQVEGSLINSIDEGQEDENDEEEDDMDFNPFLQHSPTSEGNSGISSEGEEEEDGEVEEGLTEEAQNLHDEETGPFGHDGMFVELTGDGDQEDEDIDDDEDEEEEREDDDDDEEEEEEEDDDEKEGEEEEEEEQEEEDEMNKKKDEGLGVNAELVHNSNLSPPGSIGQQSELHGAAGENALSDQMRIERGEAALMTEPCKRNLDSRMDKERKTTQQLEEEMMGCALEALPELKSLRDERFSMERQAPQINESQLGDDAIFKRTRAHYSLADMSLDQLEMFLQESDEEDYFQNVDDEEEYRKFLTAVKQQLEGKEQEKPQEDIEDDDEDDDADFEVEIEDIFGSDYEDTTEKISQEIKSQESQRRPETRGKTRERIQKKERLLGLAKTPLRRLIPYAGRGNADGATCEGDTFYDGTTKGRQITATKRAAVNGFTAHQIGQLYCLIHEHVQLLLQVFSLSILEPSRQQIATDVHKLLVELADRKDSILSWKRSAFPDFCFRPPYTHASVLEDHGVHHAETPVGCATSAASLERPSSFLYGANGCVAGIASDTISRNIDGQRENLVRNTSDSSAGSQAWMDRIGQNWVPTTSGPVRSLLDVAPLALAREFLADVAIVVEDYRRRHVESGDYHSHCEKEPLFPLLVSEFKEPKSASHMPAGFSSLDIGHKNAMPAKKTMAATLVENTKKQCIALVPKEISSAIRRFFLLFNAALYPHKPPPVATASRLLFTDAEDGLLAMGLMIYNTDWGAIQQRFLPSKSTHQIFVRQKNRSSSKAPENCIKAVRRMKASPLTGEEVACIQEALRCFKFDWNKVWMFSVPHRDPSLLPRQLRLALGTQKSYKLDESSRERRRIYEANRRSAKTSSKDNMNAMRPYKDGQEMPSDYTINEAGEATSGDEDGDDSGEAYIHEAFLADWKPCNLVPMTAGNLFPSVGVEDASLCSSPTSGIVPELANNSNGVSNAPNFFQPLQVSHFQGPNLSFLPSSNLANATLERVQQKSFLKRPPKSSFSQCHQPQKRPCVQTVKLAPGLPSVNLPPHVRVISLSKGQSKPPATRANVSCQFQTGGFISLSHNNSIQDGIPSRSAQESSVHPFAKCKSFTVVSAETGSSLSEKGNCEDISQVLDRNHLPTPHIQEASDQGQKSVLQLHQDQVEAPLHPLLLQQTIDPNHRFQSWTSDPGQYLSFPKQDHFSIHSTSSAQIHPFLQPMPLSFHPFLGVPRAVRASGCSRPKLALRPAPIRCTASAQRGYLDFHPLLQHQVAPKQVSSHAEASCAATGTISSIDCNKELSCSTAIPMQVPAHCTEPELQESGTGSTERLRPDGHVFRSSLDLGQSSPRETLAQPQRESNKAEAAQHGKKIWKKFQSSTHTASVNDNGRNVHRGAFNGSLGSRKRLATKQSSNRALEKSNNSPNSRLKKKDCKSLAKKRVKKGEKVDALTGTNGSPLHIVMEQEELSDSDEEMNMTVQFEYEEMLDSDIETSEGIHPVANTDKDDCSIEFEEEEIGTDESEEENVENFSSNAIQGQGTIISNKESAFRDDNIVGSEEGLCQNIQSTYKSNLRKKDRYQLDLETYMCKEVSRSDRCCKSRKKAARKGQLASETNHQNQPMIGGGRLGPASKKGMLKNMKKMQETGSESVGFRSLNQSMKQSKASAALQPQLSNHSITAKCSRKSASDTTAFEAAQVLAVIHQSPSKKIKSKVWEGEHVERMGHLK